MPNTVQLANLAIACALYAGGAVGALHFLNREYEAISQPLSYYAVGASGWVMTSVLGAFAVSVLALAFILQRDAARLSRAGIAFLFGAGAALALATIFPTDVTSNNLPVTLSGALHVAASYFASPCLVAAALLLSRRPSLAYALALASWLALVGLVLVNHFNLQVGGIGQRIFLAIIGVWVILTAMGVRRSYVGARNFDSHRR